MKDQDKQGEQPVEKSDDQQQPKPHKPSPRGKQFSGRGVEKKG